MNTLPQTLLDAFNMFAFLAVELTILFLVISYLVGLLQFYISPEKIRHILSSQNGRGYVLAGLLGAITPFCSCSTIPFLKGLLRAQAGFGTMLVFLFASPLVNPIIIGLFAITLGVKVAVIYLVFAMLVSIAAGYTLEKMGFEKYVRDDAYDQPPTSTCNQPDCQTQSPSKWLLIWQSTWTDFKKVLPYLLGGLAIGAFIYGFMPTELVAKYASGDNPFAIPVAAVIGIPLYIRAEAVIPLSTVLIGKGMGLGAVMALIIGSAGASLTEVILLKSLFRKQMIYAFLTVVISMAVSAGFIYQYVF